MNELDNLKEKFNKKPSIEILDEIIKLEKSATSVFNRGIYYFEKNLYKESIEDFKDALDILEEENDKIRIGIMNNIAITNYEYVTAMNSSLFNNKKLKEDIIANLDNAYMITEEYSKIAKYKFSNRSKEEIMIYINSLGNSIEDYCKKGLAYTVLKEYENAIIAYEYAYKMNQSHNDIFIGKAHVYKALGENEKALMLYDRAIANYSTNMDVYLHKASIYEFLEEYDKALDEYQAYLDNCNEDDAYIYNKMGKAYLKASNYNLASEAFYAALLHDPTRCEYYINIIDMFLYNEDSGVITGEESLDLCNKMIIIFGENIKYNNKKIELLIKLGKIEEAILEIDIALKIEDNVINRAYLQAEKANLFIKLNNFHKALDNITIAIKTNPKAINYFTLACIYIKVELYDKAIKTYNKIISFNPEEVSLYMPLVKLYIKLEDYNKALSILNKCDKLEDKGSSYYLTWGLFHTQLGEYEKANDYYNLALKEEEDDKQVYYRLAKLSLLCEDYIKVINYLTLALECDDTEYLKDKIYNCFGTVYYKQKKYKKALVYYKKALSYNDKFDLLNNNLGDLYFSMKKYSIAFSYYGKISIYFKPDVEVYKKKAFCLKKNKKHKESKFIQE